jgi:hypothetical protein
MSKRARQDSLRAGITFTRTDFASSCHAVSGFFTADDKEQRGNEDDTEENIHHERHGSVPPS